MINNYLLSKKEVLDELCKEYNVVSLYAFGSIVDGRFIRGKSDIDLLVDFDSNRLSKKEAAKNHFKLWIQLQDLFDCDVDLVLQNSVKGEYFKKYLDLYKELLFQRATEANIGR